jgi:hypothetical protein
VESVISNANEPKVAGKVTDNNKNSDPDWLGLQVTPGATFSLPKKVIPKWG